MMYVIGAMRMQTQVYRVLFVCLKRGNRASIAKAIVSRFAESVYQSHVPVLKISAPPDVLLMMLKTFWVWISKEKLKQCLIIDSMVRTLMPLLR
jgi:hypothetical protein